MPDVATVPLRGSEYLRTVLGPPAVSHAGGELRVTAVDLYAAGLHVHLYFRLCPRTTLTPPDRDAMRERVLAGWPECPPDQLDVFAELKWLADGIRSSRVSDEAGTDYAASDGGGQYLGRRAVLMDVIISPRPPTGRCTMRWGRTALDLDLRAPATAS